MKSRQPDLWQTLASVRLTLILLAGIIGISVLATLIAQQQTSPVPLEKLYSPATLYFMRQAGLTDLFHSGWFIALLSVFILNLVWVVADRFPAVWRLARQEAPPVVQLDQVRKSKTSGKQQDRHLYQEFKSSIQREEFRDFVSEFAGQRIGKPQTIRDEGGLTELQIAAQSGRYSRVYAYLGHFALLVILAGGVVGAVSGFEGQVSLDEGAKVDFIQIKRGNAKNWPQLRERGRVIPGFYQPGFEIELANFELENYPGTDKPKNYQSWIRFHEDGRIVSTRKIAVNQPTEFRGIRFYQAGYSKTSGSVGSVTVEDRQLKTQATIPLAKGSTYKLDHASVRVLDIDEKVEELGPAIHIEYTEDDAPSRSFWVFQNFPRYDPVARKKSRYVFTLDSVRPRFTSHLFVIQDPGARWVWVGSALLLVGLLLSLYRSHNRVWFVWTAKQVHVVGWSSKLFLFEPKFNRLAEHFRARLSRLEKQRKEKSS